MSESASDSIALGLSGTSPGPALVWCSRTCVRLELSLQILGAGYDNFCGLPFRLGNQPCHSVAYSHLVLATKTIEMASDSSEEKSEPVSKKGDASIAGLLGVELRRRQRAVLNRGHERFTVSRPRHFRWESSPGFPWARSNFTVEGPGAGGVGVDEVEAFITYSGKQGRIVGRVNCVPSHVWKHRCPQRIDDPGPFAKTFGDDTVFFTAVEEHLHADADPENRAASCESVAHNLGGTYLSQPFHAGRERPDPGNDQPIAIGGHIAICGDNDVGSRSYKCPLDREQIARPVIEHDDARHAHCGAQSTAPASDAAAATPRTMASMIRLPLTEV